MRLIGVLGLLGVLASPAFAADYDLPVLRGSATPLPVAPVTTVGPALFPRWSGFYVGGDLSFNNSTADFSTATGPIVRSALQGTAAEATFAPSQLQLLAKGTNSAFGGGAFLGYNTQWQDLILGVEGNYTHTSLNVTTPSNAVARSFPFNVSAVPVGTVTSVNLSGASGHLNLTDYAEARGRAGYVVGNLLPYGFVGLVVGRAAYSVAATTDATCITVANTSTQAECAGFPIVSGVGQSNALLWGYSVGAGLDWMLTPNIFVRGEFDFDQFAPISNISTWIFSGRVGAGYKF